MRSRCSLTSAMTGKAAAMMRRSSSATRSRSSATGRWMSPSVARASCWLTSLRLGERLLARADVFEADIHGEHPPVQVPRLDPLALFLERPRQPIEDAEPLLIARGRQLERAPQNRLRHDVRALFHEAHPQGLRAAQLPLRGAQRLLELGDRLVEQPHLLE